MAAAASSDFPAFPTTAYASLESNAAALSGLLASTYGCPEVSIHPSILSVLHGVTNCISKPEVPQHYIVSPLTANYHSNCPGRGLL